MQRGTQAAFRQGAQQQREQQHQRQRPQRRTGLVPTQCEIQRGQHGPAPAEQAAGQQGDQRQHEQVEQAPLRHPGVGRSVCAGSREQAIAERQVQLGADALQRQLPAGTGDRAAVHGQAQAGIQIELVRAQLDAAVPVLVLADQQRRAALAGTLQLPRCGHVHPLAVAQRAAEVVGRAQAAAVEVQPHLALQKDLVALAAFVAARAGGDGQSAVVVEQEGGQIAPLVRHASLRGVDAPPLHPAAAQRGIVAIAPGLLPGPRRARPFQRDLFQRRGGPRAQRQQPVSRPQLYVQAAVAFEPGRQVARQRGGDETSRQGWPEHDFARAAGHVELQLRLQHRRQAVAEFAVDAQGQGVRGPLCGGGLAQRELVAVAFDARHRLTVHAQRHQADGRRHAQARRLLRPRQRAAQLIVAGRQPQRRLAVAPQHHGRLVVRRHRLRPGASAARQRHPAGRIHVHAQAEARAILAGIQRQAAGPGALVAVRAGHPVGQEGTGVLRHVVQHPALPVAQRRRYILRRRRCSQQQAETQQSDHSSKHPLLPVPRMAGTV